MCDQIQKHLKAELWTKYDDKIKHKNALGDVTLLPVKGNKEDKDKILEVVIAFELALYNRQIAMHQKI